MKFKRKIVSVLEMFLFVGVLLVVAPAVQAFDYDLVKLYFQYKSVNILTIYHCQGKINHVVLHFYLLQRLIVN